MQGYLANGDTWLGCRSALAVVGPPGSGKSSVLEALVGLAPVVVFKLSAEAAQLPELSASRDQLGWLPEDATAEILQRRLPALAGQRALLALENYPGSAAQAQELTALLATLKRRLFVAELDAGDQLLAARVRARRVCDRCGRATSGRCSCGGAPTRRPDDAPEMFRRRLARYRGRRPDVLAALDDSGATMLDFPQGSPLVLAERISAVLAEGALERVS